MINMIVPLNSFLHRDLNLILNNSILIWYQLLVKYIVVIYVHGVAKATQHSTQYEEEW